MTENVLNPTITQIRVKLLEQGSNMQRFALDHNYKPRTVQQIIHRYANSSHKPRGILTWKILTDLSKAIGQPVIDGLEELIQTENGE